MKYLSLTTLLIALAFQACQNTNQVNKTSAKDSSITANTPDIINHDIIQQNRTNNKSNPTVPIFMIDTYRIFEESEDPSKILNNDWLDLYEENGQYYLGKVDYEIEEGYNECAELPTKTVVSKRNSILFLNFPFLKAGKIENLKISQAKIWPKESTLYTFNNQKYQLKGYGEITGTQIYSNDEGHEEVFHEVKNYKLAYSLNGGAEHSALQIDQFNNTFIKILFVGDIDRDGKLDFIIATPTNYEENSITLILSSQIKDNDIEKSSFKQDVQFDC